MTKGQRGRPIGHRLSEASKRAIAESKRGQSHKQSTKDKISRSLIIYFKQFNSLSDEITNNYCRVGDDTICDWANNVREALDSTDSVLTEKSMRNSRRMELSCGHTIERFSHELTPETLFIIKETVEFYGDDTEAMIEELEDII